MKAVVKKPKGNKRRETMVLRTPKNGDEFLTMVYNLFAHSPRLGAAEDRPEGSQYIKISSTLADLLATGIKTILLNDVDVKFVGFNRRK